MRPSVLVPIVALGAMACACSTPRSSQEAPWTRPAWPSQVTRAEAVVDFVQARVGRRYCWGGTGPACFDCSGLVQQAWASVGVRLPRTSEAMASQLAEVSLDRIQPGDILWWPGHVGIYAGDGWMVEALDARHGVVHRRLRPPRRALRPVD